MVIQDNLLVDAAGKLSLDCCFSNKALKVKPEELRYRLQLILLNSSANGFMSFLCSALKKNLCVYTNKREISCFFCPVLCTDESCGALSGRRESLLTEGQTEDTFGRMLIYFVVAWGQFSVFLLVDRATENL